VIGSGNQQRIVRRNDYRGASNETREQVRDSRRVQGVKVGGRFIGKDERLLGRDGPGQSHPLQLASRQAPSLFAHSVDQPDLIQGGHRKIFGHLPRTAGAQRAYQDVVQDGSPGQSV